MLHITKENFKEEVLDSEIPVVLDFYADWCAPCKMMEPVFEELGKEFEGKIKFAKVDTEQEQQLAGQFQVRGIPTVSIVKGTEEIERIVGFNPKEALKQKIEAAIARK